MTACESNNRALLFQCYIVYYYTHFRGFRSLETQVWGSQASQLRRDCGAEHVVGFEIWHCRNDFIVRGFVSEIFQVCKSRIDMEFGDQGQFLFENAIF